MMERAKNEAQQIYRTTDSIRIKAGENRQIRKGSCTKNGDIGANILPMKKEIQRDDAK